MSGMTQFEKDLRVYFPELADLYELYKKDKLVWDVVKLLIEMERKRVYGKLEIVYQDGKINFTNQTIKRK